MSAEELFFGRNMNKMAQMGDGQISTNERWDREGVVLFYFYLGYTKYELLIYQKVEFGASQNQTISLNLTNNFSVHVCTSFCILIWYCWFFSLDPLNNSFSWIFPSGSPCSYDLQPLHSIFVRFGEIFVRSSEIYLRFMI